MRALHSGTPSEEPSRAGLGRIFLISSDGSSNEIIWAEIADKKAKRKLRSLSRAEFFSSSRSEPIPSTSLSVGDSEVGSRPTGRGHRPTSQSPGCRETENRSSLRSGAVSFESNKCTLCLSLKVPFIFLLFGSINRPGPCSDRENLKLISPYVHPLPSRE